jgi:hypothetical protein
MGVAMNRLIVLGVVGWIVFAGLGGCQGPDPFDRTAHGGTGGKGGHAGSFGGNLGSLGGFRASGGSGAGGSGFGGSFGGSGMGGRGMGGTSGASGTGAGGAGMGGHIVDAGANCITTIVMAGYMAGTAPPCSACMDQNHTSFEMNCKSMIDCMAGQPQPCGGNCELECFNKSSGSGPLKTCVDAILMAGGCE